MIHEPEVTQKRVRHLTGLIEWEAEQEKENVKCQKVLRATKDTTFSRTMNTQVVN